MTAPVVRQAAPPRRYAEGWRPAFRGYQRMQIVIVGAAVPEYQIEAELDGPIAVGFERWADANAFLVKIQEDQRAPFMACVPASRGIRQ